MDHTPTTEPRLKAIETRQDKLEAEIIDHIEQQTHQMVTSFEAVNARLDTLEKETAAIQNTLKDHREIALSHGELLREHGDLLRQILSLMQQKSGE